MNEVNSFDRLAPNTIRCPTRTAGPRVPNTAVAEHDRRETRREHGARRGACCLGGGRSYSPPRPAERRAVTVGTVCVGGTSVYLCGRRRWGERPRPAAPRDVTGRGSVTSDGCPVTSDECSSSVRRGRGHPVVLNDGLRGQLSAGNCVTLSFVGALIIDYRQN